MNILDIQRVLSAAGVYSGALDGKAGRQTKAGVNKIIAGNLDSIDGSPRMWRASRRAVAAVQIILNEAGYEAGKVDGYQGHNTQNAYEDWVHFQETGRRLQVSRKRTRKGNAPSNTAFSFPTQKQCPSFYGRPGRGGHAESQIIRIDAAWDTRLAWDKRAKFNRYPIHKKCADAFGASHQKQLEVYGYKEIKRLNLHLTGGTYNPRRMRGGRAWSMHAYGCAKDWWPEGGGLHQRTPTAAMSREPYREFFDIYEENGIVSLGREIDRDWMHVQAARLK